MPEPKKELLKVYLPKPLVQKVRKTADKEDRTLSAVTERALTKGLGA